MLSGRALSLHVLLPAAPGNHTEPSCQRGTWGTPTGPRMGRGAQALCCTPSPNTALCREEAALQPSGESSSFSEVLVSFLWGFVLGGVTGKHRCVAMLRAAREDA